MVERLSLTDPSTPNVFTNEYQVTRFPRDHGGARHFSLWVQYQGEGRWTVSRYRNMSPMMTFDKNGVEDYHSGHYDPDYDPDAYEKNQAWRDARVWGSAEEAIEYAKTLLPTVTLMGLSDEQIMQRDPTGEHT